MIAKKYLRTYFIFAILACLPVLIFESWHGFNLDQDVTIHVLEKESYWWVSILSILRIVKLMDTFRSLIFLSNKLSEKFFHYRIKIENAKNIGIYILGGILMLAFTACCWLTVHRKSQNEGRFFGVDTKEDLASEE